MISIVSNSLGNLMMHVNEREFRNFPLWGKLEIKSPGKNKRTEAIMQVLSLI